MLRKTLYILPLVLVLMVGGLQAQKSSSSFTIKAQATVVDQAEIEVVTMKNLDIDEGMAVDGVINVSAQRDPEAAVLMVLGKAESHFRVSYVPERLIENSSGPGALLIKYELFGYDKDLQYASEAIDASERVLQISKFGEYFFWIGGRLDISKASPGDYNGEFTIEIEYL